MCNLTDVELDAVVLHSDDAIVIGKINLDSDSRCDDYLNGLSEATQAAQRCLDHLETAESLARKVEARYDCRWRIAGMQRRFSGR